MWSSSLIETWTLYIIGSIVIFLRIICRMRVVGVRQFKPDDFLIFFAWSSYTCMTVAAHIVGGTGDTANLGTDEVRLAMPAAMKASASWGSKWFMVGWFTYIGLIWTLKLNMLFLYQRVVQGLWVQKFIKPAMVMIVCAATTIVVMLLSGCRPFHKLWQVYPDPGKYCTPENPVFLITILILNLVTDAIIMAIPAPVILPIKTTLIKRVALYIMFSAGVFIMMAAILRVVFVLAKGDGQTAALWSCREDFVAVCVGQGPMLRPLFSSRFWRAGAYSSNNSSGAHYNHSKDAIELSSGNKSAGSRLRFGNGKPKDPYSVTRVADSDSTEKIIEVGPNGTTQMPSKGNGIVINVRNDVQVDSDSRVEEETSWYGHTNNVRGPAAV